MFSFLQKYKDLHENESAVIFGSGPSLNSYDRSLIPEKNVIFVGVNSLIFNDSLELDYYFCADDFEKRYEEGHPNRSFPLTQLEQIKSKSPALKTFCVTKIHGGAHEAVNILFTSQEMADVRATSIEISTLSGAENFQKDITLKPMYNHSIAFPALQFLLYVGVKKIYLVGFDAGGKHSYFCEDKEWEDNQVWNWVEFRDFKNDKYPDVEIVSVNPRNLKGLFLSEIYNE